MTHRTVVDVLVVTLAVVGLFFSLSGSVGVLRMPDLYTRIQCSTKNVTLGLLPALLAVTVGTGLFTSYTRHAVIIAFLVLVLSPASSHALSRAARKIGVPQWSGAVPDRIEARDEDLVEPDGRGDARPEPDPGSAPR